MMITLSTCVSGNDDDDVVANVKGKVRKEMTDKEKKPKCKQATINGNQLVLLESGYWNLMDY